MEVFFYGLFMGSYYFTAKWNRTRKGYLNDYTLKIGNRASLIPHKNEKSFRIVVTVNNGAIHNLYAETSVVDYIPEEVDIIVNKHDSIKAIC